MINPIITIEHKFVEFIPEVLEEGVLYISIDHCTAIHLCICGCKSEVVTPISSRGWELQFNGKSITLSPSIGNYNFHCRSHYYIKRNKIIYVGESDSFKNEIEHKVRLDTSKKKKAWWKFIF